MTYGTGIKLANSKTQRIAIIAMFAAISVVLDAVITPGFSAGVWYGWVFLLSPTNGVILGPVDGFITTLISVMVGHTVVFRESIYEYVFTLGAPIAAFISGLVYRKRNVALYFTLLLGAYFLTPVARALPIWGMWDVYLAYLILVAWTVIPNTSKTAWLENQNIRLALATFIGLEADILFRIFILVPCNGYSIFYGLTPEALAAIWAVPAPLITPIKVAVSMVLTPLLVPRINKTLSGFNLKLD
jgi:hypothetical protein